MEESSIRLLLTVLFDSLENFQTDTDLLESS